MKLELLPGTGGVVRFPAERRAKPTLALAEELAPRQDLADAMADEWANGEDRPDTLARAVQAFTMLAEALEFSLGVDDALVHLRAMNEVQVQPAARCGRRRRWPRGRRRMRRAAPRRRSTATSAASRGGGGRGSRTVCS